MDHKITRLLNEFSASTKKNFRIFLLDDDKLYLKAIHHHLKSIFQNKIEIYCFSNPSDFKDNLYRQPDVIILDYKLSDSNENINGLSLIEDVKKLCANAFTIMLTAFQDMKLAVESIRQGARDYIVKSSKALSRLKLDIMRALNEFVLQQEEVEYKKTVRRIQVIVGFAIATVVGLKLFFPELLNL